MKKAILMMVLLLPLWCNAQKTDFTGKWAINLQKTDFKQAPEWLMPRSLDVKQKADALIIEVKAYDNQRVQHYYTETIPFDGTTVETIIYSGTKRRVSLRWNNDNKGFVLTVRIIREDDDGTTNTDFTETWSLENDGKTLVIDHEPAQLNDYTVKAYYDKK